VVYLDESEELKDQSLLAVTPLKLYRGQVSLSERTAIVYHCKVWKQG